MNARKLRVVRDCPQPEPAPYKPIQYGFVGGHKAERITASPLPHEANVIARVQSMRTRGGIVAEPLSLEASVTYLRNVERARKHRVTVPQPLSPLPAGAQTAPSLAARAGRQSYAPTPAFDDEAGWDDYMRRAMAGEIEAF